MERPSRRTRRQGRRIGSDPGLWLRRSLTALVGLAALLLVPFHALLLVERLRDWSIGEPVVALRWAAAAALAALAVTWWRRGVPLLSGRRALAFWTLAFLLHAGFSPASAAPTPVVALPPEALHLLWALPLALAGGLPEALGRRWASVLSRQAGLSPPRIWLALPSFALGRPGAGFACAGFSPRPPPLG